MFGTLPQFQPINNNTGQFYNGAGRLATPTGVTPSLARIMSLMGAGSGTGSFPPAVATSTSAGSLARTFLMAGGVGLDVFPEVGGATTEAKRCLAYNSTTQSITGGATTVLTFDSETYDNDNMHSTSSNTGRITFNTAGAYTVIGYVNYPSTTGYVYVEFRLNGTTVLAANSVPAVSGDATVVTPAMDYLFAPSDYIEMRCFNGTTKSVTARLAAHSISGTSPGATSGILWEPPVGMRLSLTSNTYVTTTDVTGATTLYWTPVRSGGTGIVTGYDGTGMVRKTVTQKSLALGTLTSGKNYNVYYDYDGDALALGAAWTNDTTESETLSDYNGATVLSTDSTKLYLGMIRTTATTTTEDSDAKRFVWNQYNQIPRRLKVTSTSGHNYTGVTRQWNNSTANQVAFVLGAVGPSIPITINGDNTSTSGAYAIVSLGFNSTTVEDVYEYNQVASSTSTVGASATDGLIASLGYNFVAALERSPGATATFNSFVLSGTIWN